MRALPILAAALLACPAHAGDLAVVLTTPGGAPVHNAVVTLYPAGKPAPLGPAQKVYQVAQRDLQFDPFVLTVPVGAQVAFPNFDNVRHHVYSFSPAKKFELKLYAKEASRAVHFDRPGAVPIGCNIHDQMTAFVKVVDTGLSGQSDAAGRATIADVPPGLVVVRIWHPYLRAPENQIQLRYTATVGPQVETLKLNLRRPPPASAHY